VIALPTITTFILSVFSVCSVALKNAPENLRKITLNYAKQSQFPKKQNCRNFFFTKNLRKNSPKKTPKKQSQTNPISERPKMNAYSFLQRTYAQILSFYRQKNKAKTNPISENAKMSVTLFKRKAYENNPLRKPKKRTQNEPNFHRVKK
jgi:hypothetical protein